MIIKPYQYWWNGEQYEDKEEHITGGDLEYPISLQQACDKLNELRERINQLETICEETRTVSCGEPCEILDDPYLRKTEDGYYIVISDNTKHLRLFDLNMGWIEWSEEELAASIKCNIEMVKGRYLHPPERRIDE